MIITADMITKEMKKIINRIYKNENIIRTLIIWCILNTILTLVIATTMALIYNEQNREIKQELNELVPIETIEM